MANYVLRIHLKSDAAFGRGDGVAGLVDQEVEHDSYGLPFLRGRTLKGLLVEEAVNILYALEQQNQAKARAYRETANQIFGQSGSSEKGAAALRVGDAHLPLNLRVALQNEVDAGRLTPEQILAALTDIRRQTAMDATGKPETHSLRSIRVILRETILTAPLEFYRPIDNLNQALGLLAACVKAFRRAGTGRNRGTGRLKASLYNESGKDVTDTLFTQFKDEVMAL
ncbi:MAG: hypothetical protein DPW09_20620 [Anaerolineae bacterium]|nr:hypothetical protein [Anaerolineales bacterium]MCQ3975847.1 hypothetical protein [Anaerolineae bacterium]